MGVGVIGLCSGDSVHPGGHPGGLLLRRVGVGVIGLCSGDSVHPGGHPGGLLPFPGFRTLPEPGEQVRARVFQLFQLRERRQGRQALQVEGVEEVPRRAVEGGPSRRLPVTDDANPLALDQGLHDRAGHADPPDLLDLAAADGLAVGDERERLQQRPRIAGRPLMPQQGDRLRILLADLGAEPARDLAHFERMATPPLRERGDGVTDRLPVGRILPVLEQSEEFVDRHRPSGREQRRLDVQHQFVPAHSPTASF